MSGSNGEKRNGDGASPRRKVGTDNLSGVIFEFTQERGTPGEQPGRLTSETTTENTRSVLFEVDGEDGDTE